MTRYEGYSEDVLSSPSSVIRYIFQFQDLLAAAMNSPSDGIENISMSKVSELVYRSW